MTIIRHLPRLRELREQRVLTLRELGTLSGVEPATISKIEQGHHKARPTTLRKLAEALDVEPAELLGKPQTLKDLWSLSEWLASALQFIGRYTKQIERGTLPLSERAEAVYTGVNLLTQLLEAGGLEQDRANVLRFPERKADSAETADARYLRGKRARGRVSRAQREAPDLAEAQAQVWDLTQKAAGSIQQAMETYNKTAQREHDRYIERLEETLKEARREGGAL